MKFSVNKILSGGEPTKKTSNKIQEQVRGGHGKEGGLKVKIVEGRKQGEKL